MTYKGTTKMRSIDDKCPRAGRILLLALFLALLLASFLVSAALAAGAADGSVDARLAELMRSYEGKEAERAEAPAAVSDDELVSKGDWTTLARKYDYRYVSGDISSAPSAARLASWWNSLGDPVLTDLVYTALDSNRELAAAQAKVAEARASLGVSRADLLPWLDSVNSWTNNDASRNTGTGGSSNVYRLGIDASWEIDIFGGTREKVKAAEADLAAEHAALYNVWVMLSSEVALNYLNLCTLYERLQIAHQNLDLQLDTLEMLQSQVDSGLSDRLALNQAQYTVEQTRASIPPIKSSIEETLNALAILVGKVPGSLEEMLRNPHPIPSPDPVNLVGIPAEAIRQRPDIREAEYRLVAQVARTKNARSDLYPKLQLVGSIGIESLSTGSLFSSDSYGFSFGPRITWPIFHGGAIRSNIQVQTAREEQLLASYEQTVLSAVAEVRNALTANKQERERNRALAGGVTAAREAVVIAEDKYRNGLSDFNNVINAQSALLSLQDQYVTSQGTMASNIVQIFKALGGGWEPLTQLATRK